MRVLVLGSSGMLGHEICRTLDNRMELWGTLREKKSQYERFNILPEKRLIENVDINNIEIVEKVLGEIKPDAVINCIGIVKQRDEAKQAIPSITINSLFPHLLAQKCIEREIRVIQVSTDCVFSGLRGNYTELDNPDPVDLYGRTKLLGELNLPGTLTLRTSIIGWQLNTFSSLLGWFSFQRGRHIKGYRKAIYSGMSTAVLSVLIGDIIETRKDLFGLYHVASKPISKFELLQNLREALNWKDIVLEPDDQFFCDRSLISERFGTMTGWIAPSWDEMVTGLASEWQYYEKLNKKNLGE
jgi:dTDP-4-dehydrorhamnose reductase